MPIPQVKAQPVYSPVGLSVIDVSPSSKANVHVVATHYSLTESRRYNKCVDDIPRNVTTYPYSDTVCR